MPESSSGRGTLQLMHASILVGESERFPSPIHGRIVFFEPGHPENDVVALERRDDEIHQLHVGADANAEVADDSDGLTGAPICKAHLQRTLLRFESIPVNEGLRDEIASRARIDESDGLGASAECGSELHENAAASLHLLNARR